ncbi:branched-chain amino acid ABC transporter permease [Bosea minatitlanensis]|uniref:Branched-chain amino acid ABC transporter permease n=1 Tax=Bosea minatitlanensis TaxID=128782 RepID=A0ABW0F471_9HYPH|nr:branched-chain amino acid ABC transporter permease [Bosea minatitlanensis]MCT4494060.1 branched-chain amino acid ABC transporter permease [Bosea minatitlanensis]
MSDNTIERAAPAPLAIGTLLATLLLAAALIALPFAMQALGQPALVPLASRVLIYAVAAASLNLALGFGGMVSFGHAAFFGVGGYVVGILYQSYTGDEPFLGLIPGTDQLLITLPAAILVAGLLALVIGALSLRTSGVQFIMITLAFAQMLFFLFVSLKVYGGDDGMTIRRRNALFGLNTRDDATFYFICLAVAAVVFLLFWRIVRSRFGLVLAGIRQNERRMAAIGIAPYRYKLAAFVISGMGAGLAGALMANYMRFVSPDMLHWTKSGELMIMVILGGVGTLLGPLLGAAALVTLETVLTSWTEHWQLVLGPVLLLVVLFTQGGLNGLLARLRPGRSAR